MILFHIIVKEQFISYGYFSIFNIFFFFYLLDLNF